MIDSVRLSAEMYIPDESFRWSLPEFLRCTLLTCGEKKAVNENAPATPEY